MFAFTRSVQKAIVSQSRLLPLAAAVALAGTTLAAAVQPAAAADAQRCQELYSAWQRYKGVSTNGSGRDIQSQAALQSCRNGQVEAGVAQLEQLLKDDRIPLPRVSAAEAK